MRENEIGKNRLFSLQYKTRVVVVVRRRRLYATPDPHGYVIRVRYFNILQLSDIPKSKYYN